MRPALAQSYRRHASHHDPSYLAEVRGAPALPISLPRGLEQEPCAPLSLINPDFQQACGGNIVVLLAKAMRLTQVCRQLFVVIAQFGEHIHRSNKIRIVVCDAMQQTADGKPARSED